MAGLAIEGELRSATGKGAARKLRAAGKVPAVMYGTNMASQTLEVDAKQLSRLVEQGAQGRLVTLRLGGKERAVLLKDLQIDPIKGDPVHADFHAVALDRKLNTQVSVVILGENVKEDEGVLVHGAREITVECLPTAIPEYVELNVEDLEVGDTVRAHDLSLPPGVTLVSDPDEVIVSVVLPRAVEEEEPDTKEEPELVDAEEAEDTGAEE
jgi:large subunit ribosomal protein L25